MCVCDHTLLAGDWIFSLHLGHQWLDESMSESLILVGRSTKLHVACTHTHIDMLTHTHTHSQFEIQMYLFLKWSCICGEACGPHGTGPSCLLMGRFSLHSFHSDIPLSDPSPWLSVSHNTHTQIHTPCVRWCQQGLETLWNRPEHKEMIMSFKKPCYIIQYLVLSCLYLLSSSPFTIQIFL